MVKKYLKCLIAIFILFYSNILFVTPAYCAYSNTIDDISWSLDARGVLTISGSGRMPDFESCEVKPWDDFGDEIKRVEIEKGITSIGSYAFSGCVNIDTIFIPDTVTSIGEGAFQGCTKLKEVNISANITNIFAYAFSNCPNLQQIYVSPDNLYYTAIDGVLFDKDKTTLISYPAGKQGSYIIPDTVTVVMNGSFWGCEQLTNISFPKRTEFIGENSFRDCIKLSNITLPEGINSINTGTFENCSLLKSVVLPDSISKIDDYAFAWCSSLSDVYIPNSVLSIGQCAFKDTNLSKFDYFYITDFSNVVYTSGRIPDSVTEIGCYAFDLNFDMLNIIFVIMIVTIIVIIISPFVISIMLYDEFNETNESED